MAPDGSPDTPMAVMIAPTEDVVEADTPAIAPEPQRRRVRRKSASAEAAAQVAAEVEAKAEPETAAEPHVEPHPDTAIETNEAPVEGTPVQLDVTPQTAFAVEQALAQAVHEPQPAFVDLASVEAVVVNDPVVAPQPEVDVQAIIAEDPNQIVAPPEKPKRGWWRR